MKKIVLTLTLLAAGLTTNVNAATKVNQIKGIFELNIILQSNAGKALTNISITNAYLREPDQTIRGITFPGQTYNLTQTQINTLLSQEQTFGATGYIGIPVDSRLSSDRVSSYLSTYRYIKQLTTSNLGLSKSGTLTITINFSVNNIPYSYTCNCPV